MAPYDALFRRRLCSTARRWSNWVHSWQWCTWILHHNRSCEHLLTTSLQWTAWYWRKLEKYMQLLNVDSSPTHGCNTVDRFSQKVHRHSGFVIYENRSVSDFRFQISYFRFQISNFIFQISDFTFQISDFRFHILDFIFQISYFRFQISHFGFQRPHFIFQIADFRI